MGPVLIIAMLAVAFALVVLGYSLRPEHSARWPLPLAAARFVEQRAELLVLSGMAMLTAGVAWLLLFLIAPMA